MMKRTITFFITSIICVGVSLAIASNESAFSTKILSVSIENQSLYPAILLSDELITEDCGFIRHAPKVLMPGAKLKTLITTEHSLVYCMTYGRNEDNSTKGCVKWSYSKLAHQMTKAKWTAQEDTGDIYGEFEALDTDKLSLVIRTQEP